MYRRRALASEAVTNTDFKHSVRTQGKLNSVLQKTVQDLRTKLYSTTNDLLAERRDRQLEALRGIDAANKVTQKSTKHKNYIF